MVEGTLFRDLLIQLTWNLRWGSLVGRQAYISCNFGVTCLKMNLSPEEVPLGNNGPPKIWNQPNLNSETLLGTWIIQNTGMGTLPAIQKILIIFFKCTPIWMILQLLWRSFQMLHLRENSFLLHMNWTELCCYTCLHKDG